MDCKNYNFGIPSPVAAALNRLNEHGFEAYCVGGCVRDYIMGIPPHDFDITTSALPEEVTQCFSDCRVIETGLKHGTVTVILQDEMLEITTFRTDGTYSDGRHPDNVTFTRSLEDDLSRRDFTVNAMAYNPSTGLVDPFGGRRHIEQKVICCVGEAVRRFSEDALRIMRALRFSAVLGFEIEKGTQEAVFEKLPMLKKISSERIYAELVKLLCGKNAEKILLDFREVFASFMPPLAACFDLDQKTKYHKYDVYTHIVKTVAYCESIPVVRLAALFHDIEKPSCFFVDEKGIGHAYGHQEKSAETAKKILRFLHADNKTIYTVCDLVRLHDNPINPDKKSIKKLISRTSFEFIRLLLKLKKGDMLAHLDDFSVADTISTIEKLVDELEAESSCLFVSDLAIGGKDLIEIGVPKGKEIGEILNSLLELVINEKIANTREELINKALEMRK